MSPGWGAYTSRPIRVASASASRRCDTPDVRTSRSAISRPAGVNATVSGDTAAAVCGIVLGVAAGVWATVGRSRRCLDCRGILPKVCDDRHGCTARREKVGFETLRIGDR